MFDNKIVVNSDHLLYIYIYEKQMWKLVETNQYRQFYSIYQRRKLSQRDINYLSKSNLDQHSSFPCKTFTFTNRHLSSIEKQVHLRDDDTLTFLLFGCVIICSNLSIHTTANWWNEKLASIIFAWFLFLSREFTHLFSGFIFIYIPSTDEDIHRNNSPKLTSFIYATKSHLLLLSMHG